MWISDDRFVICQSIAWFKRYKTFKSFPSSRVVGPFKLRNFTYSAKTCLASSLALRLTDSRTGVDSTHKMISFHISPCLTAFPTSMILCLACCAGQSRYGVRFQANRQSVCGHRAGLRPNGHRLRSTAVSAQTADRLRSVHRLRTDCGQCTDCGQTAVSAQTGDRLRSVHRLRTDCGQCTDCGQTVVSAEMALVLETVCIKHESTDRCF